MKHGVWRRCLVIGWIWMLLLGAGILSCHAAEEAAPVSHGVQILAASSDVAVAAPVGNEVVFSADLFARGMNLSHVDSITVRTLPAVTDGELLLGSTRVVEGQTITASELPYLVFCAAGEQEMQSRFCFSVNGSPISMVCNVYLLEQANYTPTVSMASGLSLNVSTYRDLCVHGTLSAYDPDGDDLTFEVISYPQNGWIVLTDSSQGTYVYTPAAGYVGSDRFSYVARDRYGNYSASATVELRVALSGTAVTYVDMADSPALGAAISLTEAGVMSGTQMGNQHYFYPNDTVTRAEFLVMAMNAAGITNVPNCYDTGFADDADIPPTMKGYVATAYAMKYISGSLVEGKLCFLPNEEITRAQAAVILSGIVGLCDVAVTPTFADGSQIPVWASEAIYSLNAAGILTPEGGYISATSKLTREQTARLLAAVMQYEESLG